MDSKRRGGNHGGGPTPRGVVLSVPAARYLRQRAALARTARYTSVQAGADASAIIEQLAARRLVYLSDDMRAALPYLEQARRMCFDETAARGLDSLIAALWTRGE